LRDSVRSAHFRKINYHAVALKVVVVFKKNTATKPKKKNF